MPLRKLIRWMPLLVLLLALSGCAAKTSAPAPGKPHSATLTWDASTSKVRGYHIYRSTDPKTKPGLLAVTPADVTRYEDKAVDPGQTYYYSVKSVGLDGIESTTAAEISATIPAN